jgi:hypothetical protein
MSLWLCPSRARFLGAICPSMPATTRPGTDKKGDSQARTAPHRNNHNATTLVRDADVAPPEPTTSFHPSHRSTAFGLLKGNSLYYGFLGRDPGLRRRFQPPKNLPYHQLAAPPC